MDGRYEKGLEIMGVVAGDNAEKLVANIESIAPGFSNTLIEFAFGDICARPGLDLKARELATVAALTAMGNAAPQLRLHIDGALNAGCSRTEITEVIVQMALYAGIPAALNGLTIAKDVFVARFEL
jgi:4-carboxymuconolactone decarboxylase